MRPWSRVSIDLVLFKVLAGSLVYDSGFPSKMETAVNPGSNPGGRTTLRQMFRNI